MIETLKNIDTRLFLFLNGKHNEFWDVVMFWTSKEITWIPLYIFLLYLVYKKQPKQTLLVLVLSAVLITITDQLSVHAFKNVFLRYRPSHNLNLQGMVHHVNDYMGGKYGFISSHATNTFALATFISLIMGKHYKHIMWYLLLWASFVSYSRIYLGVHYPADVTVGALVGMVLAYFIYKLYIYLDTKYVSSRS